MRIQIVLRAVTAAMVASVNMAFADTFEWAVDADGDWNNASNWTRTAGTTRDFPNSTADVAHLLNATTNRTITVPDLNPGGISLSAGELHVGSSGNPQSFMIGGAGLLRVQDNVAHPYRPITLNAGSTLQIDGHVSLSGYQDDTVFGSGMVIVNGTLETRHIKFGAFTISLRLNSPIIQIENQGSVMALPGLTEIGIDGSIVSYDGTPRSLSTASQHGGWRTIRPLGADRVITNGFSAIGGGTIFDLADHDMEIQGNISSISAPTWYNWGGSLIVKGGKLTLSGTVGFGANIDGDNSIAMQDGGILVLRGDNTATDNISFKRRSGSAPVTVVFANTTGSATGSGNRARIRANTWLEGGGTTASDLEFENTSGFRWARDEASQDTLTVGGNLTINDDFSIEIVDNGVLDHRNAIDIIAYGGTFSGAPEQWTVIKPAGFEKVNVIDTGTAIRLTDLPVPPSGTVILLQ